MQKKLLEIVGGNIYYKESFHQNMVVVLGEFIQGIYDLSDPILLSAYEMIKNITTIETIDANGSYVIPGFIDVHIHGYKGADVMDGDVKSLQSMKANLVENGVTQFLATTMTMEKQRIINALEAVREVMGEQKNTVSGAEIIGVHLEGPFINSDYKGAQSGAFIVGADHELLNSYKDIIKVVTIAPEVEGNMEAIEKFGSMMNFSIGHSGATYDEAIKAIECGACGTTHLFNAMTGLRHREPGIVGAALSTDIYSELIADNIHIRPELFPFILKNKGYDKLLLITDCMQGGGLAEGMYDLGGQEVTIKAGKCTLASGTIAGSVLKLHKGIQNFTEGSQKSLAEILPLATINQARYLGIEELTGSIEVGKFGHIVIMDKDFNINRTIVKGQVVYEN